MSIWFRAKIIGVSSSINCNVKKRFLSRTEASTTFITMSGLSKAMYSLEITSSMEKVESE